MALLGHEVDSNCRQRQHPAQACVQTTMSLSFSGAVTSSPVKKRPLLADQSCESLGLSLLSPDASYSYSENPVMGSPGSCRHSPRLLTNGYYVMTEDSYWRDNDGNVSLTPSKTNVSYKENLVRIFRRRRRPRSLTSLLSDMTETCQSWFDAKVFRGVFHAPLTEPSRVDEKVFEGAFHSPPVEPSGVEESFIHLESSCSFAYDHTEIIPPPDKVPPPTSEPLMLEEICEICHEQFTQSFGGLSEVPPPSAFHSSKCCPPAPPEESGLTTMNVAFLFIFTVFIFTAIYSRCLLLGLATAVTTCMTLMTFTFITKSGPMAKWRRAKTEDITSRNE